MTSTKRILVHLQRKGTDNSPVLAKFTQSVINYFQDDDKSKHIGEVTARLENNTLILTNDTKENEAVKIKRPSFCPITNISQSDVERLPEETLNRGVDVGAAVILESSDKKVLLTRRAKTLRTFPGVWVPPGGHVEENETFKEAGLRELCEETGLQISPSQCESGDLSVLALWESVYPPKLTLGLPKRHHIVVYLHAKLKSDNTADLLSDKIKLEPDEVDACAWFDVGLVEAITAAKEEDGPNSSHSASKYPESIRGFTVNEKKEQNLSDIPLAPLFKVSGVTEDHERVSTGTKFALEEWLNRTKYTSQ